MPRPVVDAAMLVSGATMGAGVTPEAVAAVGRYPVSLAILALSVVAVTAASMLWLTRVSGWRREDALLASIPGSLTTVMAVAADRNAAVGAIAIVQASRLFILIMLLPSGVVLLGGGAAGTGLIGEGMPVASPGGLLVTFSAGSRSDGCSSAGASRPRSCSGPWWSARPCTPRLGRQASCRRFWRPPVWF
jgi:uncharacterized membrane protein AbrB (regulator of aidB expression)